MALRGLISGKHKVRVKQKGNRCPSGLTARGGFLIIVCSTTGEPARVREACGLHRRAVLARLHRRHGPQGGPQARVTPPPPPPAPPRI